MVRICQCLPNYFYHYVVDLGHDANNYTYFDYFSEFTIFTTAQFLLQSQ